MDRTPQDCDVLVIDNDRHYAENCVAPAFASNVQIGTAASFAEVIEMIEESSDIRLILVELDFIGRSKMANGADSASHMLDFVYSLKQTMWAAHFVILTRLLSESLVNRAQLLGLEYVCKDGASENIARLAKELNDSSLKWQRWSNRDVHLQL